MKSIMRLLLRVTLTLAAAAVFAQDAKRDYKTEHERKGKNNNEGAAMNIKENINVVREISARSSDVMSDGSSSSYIQTSRFIGRHRFPTVELHAV